MPYRQYTRCVTPEDHRAGIWGDAISMGVFAGLLAFVSGMLVAAAAGTGLAFGFLAASAAGIAVVTTLISAIRWWLYGRLICLGADHCVIGMLLSFEGEPQLFDTDYTLNLLLPPSLPGDSQMDVRTLSLDAHLIQEQSATRSLSLPYAGYQAPPCDPRTCGPGHCRWTEALHCEFEGAGMQILYDALKILLALMIAAAVASVLCLIPIFGWIACLIALVLFFIAAQIIPNALFLAANDRAYPSDVNPSIHELHQNGCDGMGADILVISGSWVYDSMHGGWNEIHPVKYCQRVAGTWTGAWTFDYRAERDTWCAMIAGATSPLTETNQKLPQHQWAVHPDVDGCTPADEEPILI